MNFAIIFYSGLRDFIYRVSRAFSTRINVNVEGESTNELSFEETCQIVGDIFLWFKETKQACGPSYPITKWQLIIASELASEAESFFLAHELGHVRFKINQHPDRKDNIADEDLDEWLEEYEADRFAISVLLKPAGEKFPFATREISYAGAEIGLLIYSGLEKLGFDFRKTHPCAEKRLCALREHVESWYADEQTYKSITNLAACNEQVFSKIIDHISNADYEAFLDRASASIMNEIEVHLDRCTGGPWPDYLSFKSVIFDLFNKGYSHKLYERIAKAAKEFTDRMERISDSSEKKEKS